MGLGGLTDGPFTARRRMVRPSFHSERRDMTVAPVFLDLCGLASQGSALKNSAFSLVQQG
jgi:hypothetical protein